MSSGFGSNASVEFDVNEKQWVSGSGIGDEPSGSAEVISIEDTDVKDDEENHEKASSNKDEQVKEVSGVIISGVTTMHESTLGASITTQTGLVSERSTMQEAGSSETGFGSGTSTATEMFSLEHSETAINGVDLGVSFKDQQVKEVYGELKSGTSTTAQESDSGASITTETGLDSERSTMVQAVGFLYSRFGSGISTAAQMFFLGEESEHSLETAIKGVDLGVSFKDEQLKEVSGELKSGISTTAQESDSGASITTETGLDSERSTMVLAVGSLDSRFGSGISTAMQMFSLGEESEHSAETAIKGVDVGVSFKDEQLKEVSGELKSGISTTAQEPDSGASITTETGLDSERSTMVQAVESLYSRFGSGILTTTQMFSLGEESEHSAETAIKGVDVGVSLRVHGDWASKCVAASW